VRIETLTARATPAPAPPSAQPPAASQTTSAPKKLWSCEFCNFQGNNFDAVAKHEASCAEKSAVRLSPAAAAAAVLAKPTLKVLVTGLLGGDADAAAYLLDSLEACDTDEEWVEVLQPFADDAGDSTIVAKCLTYR
jgi:hypothetical protein